MEHRGIHDRLLRTLMVVIMAGMALSEMSAQFDGRFSQYMHMKTFYNPAAVGEQQLMRVYGAQRLDWIGIKNAPRTTLFTANTPFKVKKTEHAAGLQFVNDMFGIFSNQQINLQYAYRFVFEYGTLHVGANIGVINIICYGDSVKMVESEYHSEANADPAVPTGTQSGVGFDMGLGVYFHNDHWYSGVSVLHIPGTRVRLGDRYGFSIRQMLSAMGGYNFTFADGLYRLQPSAIFYTDFASWQIQLSALLRYRDKFWGGLAYSYQNAVSIILGAEIISGLELGYCYDIPASDFIRETHGSHEIFLSYEFNLFVNKKDGKHKSIRLL
ncbi:MAG: PorP/SprF family type IX secretion system membrane protein [bacterium]|uniref:PorP/SprF family type IX secretion system membrane protein n=1 Tax=Candidatus Aphodosoma intestinipullorum TaxID=2840674 RepID=A0A940DNM8_9BACT|nr:PorP/SprF family type IX secretion system membrane protein [Candidatus Aphodosoma intestinipullorum]